jgi:alanine racemase
MSDSWRELDLGILSENIGSVRRVLGPHTDLMFVVKSDAYGHGMEPVVRCAWDNGVRRFVVVEIGEAARLRKALPEAEILVMGPIWLADVRTVAEGGFAVALVSEGHGAGLAAAARAAGVRLRCHAKIDTGMGRLGFGWETAADALKRIVNGGGLVLEGIATHFASAAPADRGRADRQAQRFFSVVRECEEKGLPVAFRHISSSYPFVCDPAWDLNGIRLGILLYGYGPREGRGVTTRPFLQWKARIIQVKEVPAGFPIGYDSTYSTVRATRIGTIGLGYADGYRRALSNKGRVIVRGRSCPVVGRVNMNWVTVDLGPDSEVREGDTAVLIGAEGGASVWADELADLCDTISYEILTGIRSPLIL